MANNRRVECTLGFKSDMTQINKDLDSLAAKLRSMGQGKGILGGEQAVTKEMNIAMNSASKLSTIMQKCRMDNGKLDVAAFKQALENAGMSAKTLANDFKALGPQGAAAFNEIARAVQTAQVPMQKTQGMLSEFATTMKNTVKWQLSSSLLHGFMSSINQAYGYSQDLNESLNNIRIVSKQSTDQMAEFAKEANKAAKELSVSTTAYTDAALIFYQQGLQGEDVTERTDVVAKMSNVTKSSVDEVSSYMTAIWNNFDDGSESLEHYADVITKLGATTASSSAEIANGLEKFAAVADVVGLSYEYATASLATVVAQTRQSADTVGTAFKTLFARIEGLKLGETLEDGVDLNKYSEALAKIGVSVLDANGQLRNMDDILDDMGAKWKMIGKEQQVALAQTVAGTRQYNQLVALMDNWDKVQENLETTKIADGELQAQADIYAQSWEAAQKRVQAAAQTIYASLMDEDFFISLANGTEKFLTILGKVINALGGLKGMWPLLMTGFAKLFGGDLGLNIGNFVTGIKTALDDAKGVFKEFKDGFSKEDITLNVKFNENSMANAIEEYHKLINTISEAQAAVDKNDVVNIQLLEDIRQRVLAAIEAEREAADRLTEMSERLEANAKKVGEFVTGESQAPQQTPQTPPAEETSPAESQPTPQTDDYTSETLQQHIERHNEAANAAQNHAEAEENLNNQVQQVDNTIEDFDNDLKEISEINYSDMLNASFDIIREAIDNADISLESLKASYDDMINGRFGEALSTMGVGSFESEIAQIDQAMKQINQEGADQEAIALKIYNAYLQIAIKCEAYRQTLVSSGDLTKEQQQEVAKLHKLYTDTVAAGGNIVTSMQNTKVATAGANAEAEKLKNNYESAGTKIQSFGQVFQSSMMNASRFAMTITQINNVIEQLNDNTKSEGEKLLAVASAAGMIAMSFKGTLGFFGDITRGASKLITLIADIVTGKTVELGITKAITKEEQKQEVSQGVQNKEQATQNAQKGTQLAMQKLENGKNSFFPATTEGGTKAAAGTGFFGKLGTGVSGLGGGTALTGTAATVAGVAAAVVAAVVVAAVIAKIAHEVAKSNAIKDFVNKSEKQDEKQEKVTKNAEDLEKVTEGYEEFHDAIKSATLSTEDMRIAALKVAEATNDQRVAALALTGSFKELDAYLQKRTLEEQKEYLDSLNASNASSESTIQAGLIAEARKAGAGVDNFGKTFDIKSLNYFNPNGTGSDDKLGKLLQEVSGESLQWGQISTEALTKAVMGEGNNGMTSEEFLNELRNIVNIGGSGAAGAQQILDWAGSDEVKKYIDDYNNNLKEIESVGLENAFTKNLVGVDEIKNAQEYENILEQIKQTAKENGVDIEAPDFEEKLNSMAMSYQELQDMAATHAIVLEIQDVRPELEGKLKNLENQLKTFSDSERSWILLHPHIAADLIDENGQMNDSSLKPIIDYAEDKSKYESLRSITDNYDANKGLDKDTLAQLQEMGYNIYQDEYLLVQQLIQEEDLYYNKLEKNYDAASKLAAEKMEAAGQDEWYHQDYSEFGENANLIKQYYDGLRISIDHEGNDTKEALKQKNKEIIEEASQGWGGSDAYGGDAINNNDEFKKLIGALGMDFQDATELDDFGFNKVSEEFTERWSEAVTELTEKFDESKESIEKYCKKIEKDYDKTTADMVKANLRVTKSLDEHISVWQEASSLVEESSKTEGKTVAQQMKDAENAVIACSKALDNLQSAYKTLHSAMKEYQEQGSMNLDTIQALVALGPQFVQHLTNEQGQFALNEEAIKSATQAYMDQMEVQQAKVLMDALLVIQEGNVESQEYRNVIAAYASKTALTEMGYSMDGVIKYAQSMSSTLPGAAAAIDGITAAAQAFKNVFAAGEKGLQSNFPRFMGVSSKGGGGKKKEKEKKDLKEYADEFDRFYPLQKVIDDLADAISDLAKEQEHLAGGELVGSIRYQNKLLQDQKKAYQELAKEQKKYQKEMQADLAKYGMSFDTASGNIVNYAQSTQAMLDQYNAAIEKYNKSAQSDADKKALEAVEKEYEKFKKLVSNYQGILTEIQDTENNLDDIYYETIANNLKEFEIMVQVNLDIKEAERMVNDFISKINKNFKTLRKSTEEWMELFDTALKNANTYVNGEFGTINVDMDALNKVKNAIDSGDYGHEGAMFVSETEAIMKYKELAEQLKDDANDLYELYKQAWEDYIDAIDESIEAWEEIIDNFDDINDTLDHYEKVIELLHDHQDTDQGYSELIDLYNKQMELQLAKQATLRKQIDTMQAEYDELIKQGAKENDKDVKAIKDAIDEANKSLQGSIEDYLETINKAFDKQRNKALDEYMESAFGFNIDDYTQEWNRAKKEMEGYYDANERILQIDKIRRKYNEAISKISDVKTQEKLAKLRDEELKDLEEMDKLAEKRVTLSEKKLALAQAEAALQDAEDNKSQMRLQRDSQGNWSYQFVADEDNIMEKQQSLADAAYEAYEITKEWTEKLYGEDIPNLVRDCRAEIEEIWDRSDLTVQQKEEQTKEIINYYQEQIKSKVDELNTARREMGETTAALLITADELHDENFTKMNKSQQELVEELKKKGITSATEVMTTTGKKYDEIVKKANESNNNVIKTWDLLEKAVGIDYDKMTKAANTFYTKISKLVSEYDAAVKRSEQASGVSWSNVKNAIDQTGNAITEVTSKVEECVSRTQALSDFRARVNEIEQAWYSVKDSIVSALSELDSYLERLRDVKEMQDAVKENATAEASSDLDLLNLDSGSGGPGGRVPNGGGNTGSNENYYVTGFEWDGNVTISKISSSGRKNSFKTLSFPSGFNTYEQRKSYATQEVNRLTRQYGGQPCSFDTGGYTGSWDNGDFSGRMAVLHQKELILNQSDTQNILDAVQLVRDMNNNSNSEFMNYLADIICQSADVLAGLMESGIHSLAENMTSATYQLAQVIRESGSRQLDQNVHIEASFPNATNRYEIESAFNNLVNVASQRANRPNKSNRVIID